MSKRSQRVTAVAAPWLVIPMVPALLLCLILTFPAAANEGVIRIVDQRGVTVELEKPAERVVLFPIPSASLFAAVTGGFDRIVGMHPEVAEVAAVAHPASVGEDDVRCVIIRAPGSKLTAEELMDWLYPRMPHFMLPRYIEFVTELPRTPSEKVEKYKLIDRGLGPDAWDREAAGYVPPDKRAAAQVMRKEAG